MAGFSYKGERGKYKRKNAMVSRGLVALIRVLLSFVSIVCRQKGKRTI